MSTELLKSLTAQNTLIDISKYENELQKLIFGKKENSIVSEDPAIEDFEFVLENIWKTFWSRIGSLHLLVRNTIYTK